MIKYLFILFIVSCKPINFLNGHQAKEYCSCLYVSKNDPKVCTKNFKRNFLPWSISNIPEKKTIQSTFLFLSMKAQYKSKRLGCQIVLPD